MKKNSKKIIVAILTLMLCIVAIGGKVNAAGTQTFYRTGASGAHVGQFHCYNNNLTPMKTIGESGTFYIYGTARKGDSLNGNVVTKIQIREYPSGRVLTSTSSYAVSTDGTVHAFETTPIYLTAGQTIKIFFDICSVGTPPGGYRSADIDYSYVLQ